MRSGDTVRAMLLRSAKVLIGVTLVLVLASCSLGEAEMPSVDPGLPADRSAGLVVPVPVPIPHALDGREECFECHAIGAVDAPPIPVDHDQDVTLCATCHAVWLAPAIAAAAPPAISHDVVDRDDCLTCHKLGMADAPRVPDNHSSLTSAICQTCHTTLGEIVGAGQGTVASDAEMPPIPHGLEGFGACSQCHEQGGPGIPRFPDDHQGRTDDICSACHSPAAEAAGPTPTTEAVATATEEAEPTPTMEVTGTPTDVAEPTPTETLEPTPTEVAEPTSTTEVTGTPTQVAEPTPTETLEPTPTQVTGPTSTTEVAATPTETPSTGAGDTANGQILYAAGCAMCHGPSGEGTTIAPEPLNDAAFLAEHTDEDLAEVIREGEGDRMPAFASLNAQEALALVALLRSWQ